jgi:hypothetical protein
MDGLPHESAKRGFAWCGRRGRETILISTNALGASLAFATRRWRRVSSLSSAAERLQWGDASGICRHAHCAGRRGREAEGGGLLNLSWEY